VTRLAYGFLFLGLFCLTSAAPAHADKRVALVIGNGFYQYQPILPNPKHDAEDVAKALGDLNFDVVLGLDLTRAGMNEKLDEFSRKADGADVAFVYYSGHGMQFGGANYLLPTDASLDSAADVNPFRLVRIDNVMETLSAVNGPKIVVLDACRDNPVANELKRKLAALRGTRGAEVTRGLSPITASSVSGLLVAYATQADETALDGKGRNSPFTAAFIKNVGVPDTDIRQMFFHVQDEVVRETDGKQRPEISVSLVGEYKLKITITLVNPSEAVPPGGSAPIIVGPSEAERAWGFVKDTTNIAVLEDFIRRFGDTFYGTLAREKLAELKRAQVAVAAPPVVPATPPGPCGGGAVTVSLSSHVEHPLSASEECSLKPKDTFRECAICPEMVVVPSGTFTMGSPAGEAGSSKDELPQHEVTFKQKFAVGKFLVTLDQFAAFVKDAGYNPVQKCWNFENSKREEQLGRSWRNPGFAQGGSHPAVCLSWNDAKAYVRWVSRQTGKDYRLLTEAEYEYVTRARTVSGSSPRYFYGDDEASMCRYGNGFDQTAKETLMSLVLFKTEQNLSCKDGYAYTAPVGSFSANGFDLYDVYGNASSWTEDCYHQNYIGAPSDGSAWTSVDCGLRVRRGGSWVSDALSLRSANRARSEADFRAPHSGFRIARTLSTP
jgi:formylglycine-generating enzyme required for sulfatase activity